MQRAIVMEENYDGYTFGKISLILVTESQVLLIVGVNQSVSPVNLGVQFIPDSLINYVCVNKDRLNNYYPLPVYEVSSFYVVSLHHSVCSP